MNIMSGSGWVGVEQVVEEHSAASAAIPQMSRQTYHPVSIHGALIKGLPTGTEELPRIPTGIESIEGTPCTSEGE